MATNGEVQAARYEFKYLVNERVAEQIRRFVLSYLEPDEYTAGQEGIGYPVHSLYLDSPDLDLCRATLDGLKNRFKLRLRFYEAGASRVYFEIKRRVNDVILKERAAVNAASVERLVAGKPPRPMDLISCDEKSRFALHNFCSLRDVLCATPSAYTSYAREGYEPRGSNVCRVTFDRALRAGEFHGRLSIADLESWARPEVHGVVLELKFTDTFPNWMQTMVESFNLLRCSMPKYVKCVSLVRTMRHEPAFLRALNQGMDSGEAEKVLQRSACPAIGPIDAQMIA